MTGILGGCAARLIASSVVRGVERGETHGGLCIVDFGTGGSRCVLDWNTTAIDVDGRGGDRGLRGIAVVGEEVYVLSSAALLVFDTRLHLRRAYHNSYLRHCHELSIYDGRAYITSTGYDSILAFDLDSRQFTEGYHLRMAAGGIRLLAFDPRTVTGPAPSHVFHLNSVSCSDTGLYFAGLRSPGLLRLRNLKLSKAASLPSGTHNAQPFDDGVIFNDTANNQFCARTSQREIAVSISADSEAVSQWTHADDANVARPLFARGLCRLSGRYVAGGFSPSTVAIYDLEERVSVAHISLSNDVRNAIHGLAVWPFEAAPK